MISPERMKREAEEREAARQRGIRRMKQAKRKPFEAFLSGASVWDLSGQYGVLQHDVEEMIRRELERAFIKKNSRTTLGGGAP